MPPPDDGNEYLEFERLIKVEQVGNNRFKSIALPFTPGGNDGGWGHAYGAHVFAQAAWAACQTVAEGFQLSNVSGNFLLRGIPKIPYIYHVHNVRDGRSYCTRIVSVSQKKEAGPMFTSTCVFKLAETSPLDVQAGINIWDKYKVSLEGKRPMDFEQCPSMDLPWYWRAQKEGKQNDRFPGLDCRKADMTTYNRNRHPLDRRHIIFYRSIGTLPEDPNMHLVAHLYASDRNSLYLVANSLEIGDVFSGIGSLVHQVIFHTNAKDMNFGEDRGPEKSEWFVKEDWTTRYSAGRGMLHSRVWSPEGKHVMTVTQDGLIRLPQDSGSVVEGIVKGWQGLPEEEAQEIKRTKEKL